MTPSVNKEPVKLDVKAAARRLGISHQTLYREVERGAITHRRLGKNRILFDEAHLQEYEARRLRPARAA